MKVELKVNDEKIELNEFVTRMLAGLISAVIEQLRLPGGKVETIEIKLKK